MMRERCFLPMMMKAMRTLTNPRSPTSCPTRASTRLDMDAPSAGMTPVQRTSGRFQTTVALLLTGVFLMGSNHAAVGVEEDSVNASTNILNCDLF